MNVMSNRDMTAQVCRRASAARRLVGTIVLGFAATFLGCGVPERSNDSQSVTAPLNVAAPTLEKIFLEGPPASTCVLTIGVQSDSAADLNVDTDDRGVALFYSTLFSDTQNEDIDLTTDCTTSDGNHITRTLTTNELRSSQNRLQATASAPSSSDVVVPPLPAKDFGLSQSELMAGGYPPRPDSRNAELFGAWKRIVSSVTTLKKPVLVAHPGLKASLPFANNNLWSGVAIANPGTKYLQTAAHFVVPAVTPQTGVIAVAVAAPWVGVDGAPNGAANDIIQCGTASWAYSLFTIWPSGHFVYSTAYNAWYEWYPNNLISISNFSVAPNDTILAFSWLGDASGNVTASGTIAWSYLYNWRTSVGVFATASKPASAVFRGDTAEWIMERLQLNGNPYPLAQFSSSNMTTPQATTTVGTTTWNIDPGLDFIMFNNSTTDTLAIGNVNGLELDFAWYNWN